jgi:hypothetical protein
LAEQVVVRASHTRYVCEAATVLPDVPDVIGVRTRVGHADAGLIVAETLDLAVVAPDQKRLALQHLAALRFHRQIPER